MLYTCTLEAAEKHSKLTGHVPSNKLKTHTDLHLSIDSNLMIYQAGRGMKGLGLEDL